MPELSHVEYAYMLLLDKFRQAHRVDGDKPLADRINAGICLLEELWPDDCERYVHRFKDQEN